MTINTIPRNEKIRIGKGDRGMLTRKTCFRVPVALHDALEMEAMEQGVIMSVLIRDILATHIEQQG